MSKKGLQILSLLFLVSCHNLQQSTKLDNPAPKAKPTAEKLEATLTSIKANIIDKKCLKCHSAGSPVKSAAKIPFETEEQILKGTIDDGPLVIPGKSTESPLFKVMSPDPAIQGDLAPMPPKKSIENGSFKAVTPEELQVVEAWINGIAVASPEPSKPQEPTPTPKPEEPKPQPPTPADPTPVKPEPVTPTPTEPAKPPVPSQPPAQQPPAQEPPAQEPPAQTPVIDEVNFEKINQTILIPKCLKCHKSEGSAEEIPFEDKDSVVNGSTSDGKLIVPGNAIESIIFKSISKDPQVQGSTRKMPPPKSVNSGSVPAVTDEDIKLMEQWINSGAK